MTQEAFVYWLAGMFEGKSSLSPEQQLKMIQDHLSLCMTKVTPPIFIPASSGAGGYDQAGTGSMCTGIIGPSLPSNAVMCSNIEGPLGTVGFTTTSEINPKNRIRIANDPDKKECSKA